MLKIIDLIETILFVLRKKNKQISFLHIYHHISTVLLGIIYIRYYAGGMAMLFPVLNCIVHVVMYTYYLLSNIEGLKEIILPFKRYVTIIQMVTEISKYYDSLMRYKNLKSPKILISSHHFFSV